MRRAVVLIPVFLIVGCATTQKSEYVAVPDHKYNTVRYVKQETPSAFIGTSATQPRTTPPRQHP